MVRRRSKNTRTSRANPRPLNRSDGKLGRWEKLSDIPLDEEDQFHAARDKILLDGGDHPSDEDGDEDEVFELEGLSEDDEDFEDDQQEEDVDTQDLGRAAGHPVKKKASSTAEAERKPQQSDSEDDTWGRSKAAYYSSNAAEIESDEEANQLEEQEAMRLQRMARDAMTDADFGFEDAIDVEEDQEPSDDILENTSPTPVIIQDKISAVRHLEKHSPETLALARDWDETAWNLTKCQDKIRQLQLEEPDALSLGMVHLHYQTLLTYATMLAFYLHLRSSEKYARRPELLQAHPIFPRLLTLKRSLATLEDLDFAISDSEEDDANEDREGMGVDEFLGDVKKLWKYDAKKGLDPGELQELIKEATYPPQRTKRDEQALERPKKKRKTSTVEPGPPLSDFTEPELPPLKTLSSRVQPDSENFDAYGEATSLHHADAADKNARKKSLRFHTSKIESASMRRQGARSKAVGGDDDLPYKERRKEKEARLVREAKVNSRGQGGEDLEDDTVVPTIDRNSRVDDDDETSDEDGGEQAGGYYELVKQTVKLKKEQKRKDYEATRSVDRNNDIEGDVSGPRPLTQAMLKNKGLTPRRPKSVRNPRVKKRQKFEKAKKKVASQKAVYKGGIGDAGQYGGERFGISKVVKSVHLG